VVIVLGHYSSFVLGLTALNALGAGEHGRHTDGQKRVQKELEDTQKVLAETSTEVEVLRKLLVSLSLSLSLYICIYMLVSRSRARSLSLSLSLYIYIYYIGRGEADGVGAGGVSVAGA